MKIIKPDNLGLLFSPNMRGEQCCLCVAALACFPLALPPDSLLEEAQMWQVVAGALGEEETFDMGHPKTRGEFLVYGACHSPQAVTGLQVKVAVAGLSKALNISGARYWNAAGLPSPPEPFTEMRVNWANAFGGEGWEANPTGLGMLADTEGKIELPRVQNPRHLITSRTDRPEPAGFSALDPFWAPRKQLLGTFDDAWLQKRWPHYPLNTDPEYFNTAPMDQRITGFFKGDEPIRVVNMHPERAEIVSQLPGLRARLFMNRLVEDRERFTEITAQPETVWLFPGAECGIVLFRGVAQVTDETLDDVAHLMAVWELLSAPPETVDFYHRQFLAEISPVEAEPEEPLAAAAAEAPQPAPPPPPPPEPPDPPPLPPELEKMMADLNEKVAQAEAQADAVFKKLGLTREEAMEKFLPKPATAPPPQAELEQMIAQANTQADAVFKKLGLAKEEALKQYASPQTVPQDPQQEIKALQQALLDMEAKLKKSGINVQEAAAKLMPDIDPATLDFRTIIAELTSLAAALPAAAEEASQPTPEGEPELVAPDDAAQADAAFDTVETVMQRHAQGKKLAGLDLSGMDFSSRDLAQADFSGSILANTIFSKAILTGARFADAVLADTDFSGASMTQSNLKKVQAVGALFPRVNLQGADMAEGDFSGCNFEGADLSRACLSRALFAGASMKESKATESTGEQANFNKADLSGTSLYRARMTAADFSDATLDQTCLIEAELSQATFDGVLGTGTDFSRATLIASRANKDTNLTAALFADANMSRSCWERARLTAARMGGAVLDAADFSRVSFEQVYLVNAIAREANFMKAVMTACDLRGVNFFKASFRHARLRGCDLKQANMFGVDLYSARIMESDVQGTDFRRAQARSGQ